MFTNVSIVSVFVTDQDEAKAFYIDKLGFVESADVTLGDGYRWCAVCLPDQPELAINLAIPGPPSDPDLVEATKRALAKGQHNGVGLSTDDCAKTIEDLRSKGVEILQEPADRPYGVEALIRDNSGNWIVIVEPKELDLAQFEQGATRN
jgi:catechol 2,3-dioxygenase-like lactoylglutathione lyase family enzyme